MGAETGDEFMLGPQELNSEIIRTIDLEEFYKLYKYAVTRIEDAGALDEVGHEMERIMESARDAAVETMGEYGIETEPYPVRYGPSEVGATVEDGELVIGRDGRRTAPYFMETEITHEFLHEYMRRNDIVDEYTPKEEALTQVWTMHRDEVLTDPQAAADWTDEAQELYNTYLWDGFGDEMAAYMDRFAGMYHDLDGAPEERMAAVLDYSFEHVF